MVHKPAKSFDSGNLKPNLLHILYIFAQILDLEIILQSSKYLIWPLIPFKKLSLNRPISKSFCCCWWGGHNYRPMKDWLSQWCRGENEVGSDILTIQSDHLFRHCQKFCFYFLFWWLCCPFTIYILFVQAGWNTKEWTQLWLNY